MPTPYAAVALDLSIDKTFDYGIPPALESKAQVGSRVEVPVRGRKQTGTIIALKETPDVVNVRPLGKLLFDAPLLSADLLQLALWMAKYYCTPLGKVIKILLPAPVRGESKEKLQLWVRRKKSREHLREVCGELRGKAAQQAAVLDVMLKVTKGILLTELIEKAGVTRSPVEALVKKGLLTMDRAAVERSPLSDAEFFKTQAKTLIPEQAKALEGIVQTIEAGKFASHLLYGITGSGKTEVYLQAIDRALEKGLGVIMLVPEVALTEQTIERFRARFEGNIAILHHRLSQGERFDEWHKIRRGDARIVIGARSAIFSPVQNLGLIIVDEEQESSYKQTDEMPCYHARDLAVMRGNLTRSTVVLGSATPSLESFYNAEQGKYQLHLLKERPAHAQLPTVRLVDMTREVSQQSGFRLFSSELLDAIEARRKEGEQALVFLNRRGYHTTFACKKCQEPIKCEHCDVALTFHRNADKLSCHLCGYSIRPPRQCPSCNGETLKYGGVGTELVERSLRKLLPEVRTLRMDADTTRHKGSHAQLLQQFRSGKADVLIGTQMIAKGLHFPQVTLVGVLNGDHSLQIPDFRASENVFQLLTQVAGRAGRGPLGGEVLIQTRMPDNPLLQQAVKQDFDAFYASERPVREMFGYPPFSHLVKIGISGPDPHKCEQVGNEIHQALIGKLSADFEILPVLPAGYAKIKDRYRFQALVRGPSAVPVSKVLDRFLPQLKLPTGVKVLVDIDPLSTFF